MCAAGLVAAPSAWTSGPSSPIAVTELVHEFGAVEQGATVEHLFRVRNTGSAPVRLAGVKSSCDCTVGVAPRQEIPAGDEAWVTVLLDTRRLAGRTTKTVRVYTEDPTVPEVPLSLTGEVLVDLLVAPTPVWVGSIHPGDVVRREVVVRPGRPGGTDLVSVAESDSPAVHARLEPAGESGEQRLVVEVGPDLPEGRFNAEVLLRTTSARQPLLRVPVLGTVEATF